MSEIDASWDDLEGRPPEQVAAVIGALSSIISSYQEQLGRSLEERHRAVELEFQREREFLSGLTNEYSRLTEYVKQGAMETLERTSA